MRKIVLIAMVILFVAISFATAQASLWFGGMLSRYSPSYGEISDAVQEFNRSFGMRLELEPGLALNFASGYEFNDEWGFRVDVFEFRAITAHTRLVYGIPVLVSIHTSTTPVIFSGLYRVPSDSSLHPYFGLGVGTFLSKTIVETVVAGTRSKEVELDSALGFQLLVGAEYRFIAGFFVYGELRYLVANTRYTLLQETDWTGILAGIGVGYRFSS